MNPIAIIFLCLFGILSIVIVLWIFITICVGLAAQKEDDDMDYDTTA
jgi:hypothetical protein